MNFENKEMKLFCELSDAEILAVIKAKIVGECEFFNRDANMWIPASRNDIASNFIYRVKQKLTPLDIPWHHIDLQFIAAAMDEDGEVFVYRNIPDMGNTRWLSDTDEYARLDKFWLVVPEETIWDRSLTIRPTK